MEKWAGKIALVTGASKGLGRIIAKTLASHKMIVVACARSGDKLKTLAEDVMSQNGKIDTVECDMSKMEQVMALFKHIAEKYGTLHVCVNNAGLSFPDNFLPGKQSSPDVQQLYNDGNEVKSRMSMYQHWLTMLQINVLGLSICCKEALHIMVRSGVKHGVIINVSSMAGKKVMVLPLKIEGDTNYFMNLYGATKWAVTCISEAIRLENVGFHPEAAGIRVINLCPAWIKTNFPDRLLQGTKSTNSVEDASNKDIDGFFKDKEYLDPQEVCDVVMCALACPEKVQVDEIVVQALK